MKTSCGIRRAPKPRPNPASTPAWYGTAARVCANCRNQLTHNHHEGGTTVSSITDDLQEQAGKAAAGGKTDDAGQGRRQEGRRHRDRDGRKAALERPQGQDEAQRDRGRRAGTARGGKPLHVKELTERILAMPDTKLGGKTPEATVGAILAVNIKKSDTVFRRTKPGTYAIRKGK
jgi:hypothetical protein